MNKKIIFLILVLLFPLIVNAETCDKNKISISSIKVDSKSNNVEELNNATASGKDINLNLSMTEVGDNVKYKIVVKNDSDDDYELDKSSFNISSDYIKYNLESEDDSMIVKANSTKTVYLRVKYNKAVKTEAFVNGVYSDTKDMAINLSSNDKPIVSEIINNPSTGFKYIALIIMILFIIISTLIYLITKKKKVQVMLLIIGTAIVIPTSVNALCKCQINIKSKVIFYHPFTGTIYRASSTTLKDGDLIDVKKITCSQGRCNYIDENEFEENYPPAYIKHDIVENEIKASYACNENVCFKGGSNANYEENKNLFINNETGWENLTETSIFNRHNHDNIDNLGNIRVGSYCGYCIVNADSTSQCAHLDLSAC